MLVKLPKRPMAWAIKIPGIAASITFIEEISFFISVKIQMPTKAPKRTPPCMAKPPLRTSKIAFIV